MKFPFFKQQDQMDCGPTALRMICAYYGRRLSITRLRTLCFINKSGVNLLSISEAAEKIGFRTSGVKLNLDRLKQAELPCVLHWRQTHFVVLYSIKGNRFYIADPTLGLIKMSSEDFAINWYSTRTVNSGVALLLKPTPFFFEEADEAQRKVSWYSILKYFYAYKKLFFQLILGLAVGTILSLIAPFLTQSIVDVGINTEKINFVYLILIAQLMLFAGNTMISFIRSWILLNISIRVNISILTDFLIKLMKLPMSFFETKTTGDIMQRMNDQQKIEGFLTGTALSTLFSIINLVIFTFVLAYYNFTIFLVSLSSSLLYAGWIYLFLKRRRILNHKQFQNSSSNQSNIVELIGGMQEIKLNNCERQKRWGWEQIQAKLFHYRIQNLSLSQYQQGGSLSINQIKNIFITFLSVKAVIDGQLTLGGMMAIQYIVGQVSGPIEQLLSFVQSYQDAKISLERLNEIHELEDEESVDKDWNIELPENKTIEIKNLTFTYPGAGNEPVLEDISLTIPEGKITAIVGMSGSGKTTLLKMLLRVYLPQKGEIRIGNRALKDISFKTWREACGTVLQDGFIFSDTIENNIGIGDEYPDRKKLEKAVEIANIEDMISDLPFGLKTRIGAGGNGISQGQKQRLLIARAVYKNPDYLFFDEATNALDANNERTIMENLTRFFHGKTVVIVAHRLSTVKQADNILVFKKGEIIESGNHQQLISLKGDYHELVKNQLELAV